MRGDASWHDLDLDKDGKIGKKEFLDEAHDTFNHFDQDNERYVLEHQLAYMTLLRLPDDPAGGRAAGIGLFCTCASCKCGA
jgi:hypothetical protein